MAKHRGFTRKKFIDALPNDLRRDYLSSRKVDFPDGELTDDVIDKLLGELDELDRKDIEEEFHCINDIADRGIDCLERAYQEYGYARDDDWTRERAAMVLFLRYPEAFQMAYDLYAWRAVANSMSHYYLPSDLAAFDAESLNAFKGSVDDFYGRQGKGRRCRLRHYSEDTAHVVLVGRGDYPQSQLVQENDGEIRTVFFRPAKEDVLLYDTSGLLSIKTSSRSSEDRMHYLAAFGTHILGKSPEEIRSLDAETVSLAPIRNGTFSYDGNELVEWARLADMTGRLPGVTGAKMRLSSPDLVRTFSSDMRGLRLEDCELDSAKLKFKLSGDGFSARPIAVELRPPERTSLNKRRETAVIEAYLRENGVLLV